MKDKFTGRCPHGNIPGSCIECSPTLTKEQVMKNTLDFLKQMDEQINYMDLCDRVEIRHLDGSELYFNNALLKEEENGWFTVCTEHLGNMKLNKYDCLNIAVNGKIIYEENSEIWNLSKSH